MPNRTRNLQTVQFTNVFVYNFTLSFHQLDQEQWESVCVQPYRPEHPLHSPMCNRARETQQRMQEVITIMYILAL